MKIRIYRKSPDIPLPVRQTPGSAGLDIYAAEHTELMPGEVAIIPTGLIIESPPGYYFTAHIRSGFSVKNGISLVNDVGIIDEDYCGPEDELRIAVIRHYNPRDPLGSEPFVVERGTRFAQIIFHRHAFEKIEWEEMENPDFAGQTRGGFGSTGKK